MARFFKNISEVRFTRLPLSLLTVDLLTIEGFDVCESLLSPYIEELVRRDIWGTNGHERFHTSRNTTYLGDPKDVVTLNNQIANLTDGTNHLLEAVLDAKSKQISDRYHKRGLRPVEPLSQD